MQRRTFLQGTAASIVAARFGAAFAQDQGSSDNAPRAPTIIYNKYFTELRELKFTFLDATADQLSKYGLQRPPLRTSPIYPLWFDTFSRDLIFEDAASLIMQVDNQLNPRFQQAQVPLSTRYETSPNWSGAYVSPRDGNMLLEVAGIWRVPGIDLSGGLSGLSPATCSIWIGLDGQRRYIDASLPQIGTWQQIDSGGTLTYFGWYQWWVRGQPSILMLPQVPFTVSEGDVVFCRVQASGPSEATVSMTKLGLVPESWSGTIHPDVSPFTHRQPIISGATAQWVVERPTVFGSDELYRLPRFDPVVFATCAAEEALTLDPPTRLQSLRGARFIQMFERLGDPQRIAMLAKPRYLLGDDRDAFRVDYVGS